MTNQPIPSEKLVAARLTELVDRRTPWHRGLWQIGTVLALKEVLEYADGVRSGATRSEGLGYVTASAHRLIQRDRALAEEPLRARISEILEQGTDKRRGVVSGHVADSLEQFVRRVEKGYLERWAHVCSKGLRDDEVELAARLVTAHLVDAGFSADHLHGWLLSATEVLPASSAELAALMQGADEMNGRDWVAYEVAIPFEKLPPEVRAAAGQDYLGPEDLRALLQSRQAPMPGGREGAGALVFRVRAREPRAAIAAAEIQVRRLSARVVVGLAAKRVRPTGKALVLNAKRPKWHELRPHQGGIHVASLVRGGLLMPAQQSAAANPLDDAFELLAAVETSTSWASVAAIWAAVEGLLSRPTETGVDAADRMSAIVACSFPRAELTQLADALASNEDDLGEVLRSTAGEPLGVRLSHILDDVRQGRQLVLADPTDAAAAARLRAMIAQPHVVLARVRQYYSDAFRRLFNQRNLLLHGGRFDSVVLPATIRTVPPLVAAGVDRLVHVRNQEPPTSPRALAARASNELGLVGRSGGREIHRLLD